MKLLSYVPHGIDPNKFYPIIEDSNVYKDYIKFKNEQKERIGVEFIALFNSRNIRRKMPSDIILAFKHFTDSLPEEKANKCALMLHTDVVDPNGTDLSQVVKAICPDRKIIFSNNKVNSDLLNFIYNMADVTINSSFAEGWGLSTHESLMAGTMIISPVTGGLQDQMGFVKEDGSLLNENDYTDEWNTNSVGTYKIHGEWCVPMFPTSRRLVGSPPTPYIMDEHINVSQIKDSLSYVYNLGKEERDKRGILGRKYCMSNKTGMSKEYLSQRYVKCIDTLFEKFNKPNRIYFGEVNYNSDRHKTTNIQLIENR